MSLIELLEKYNTEPSDDTYFEYYKAFEKDVNEYRKLMYKSEKRRTDEENKRIEYLKSELQSVEGKEECLEYPYYVFITRGRYHQNEINTADTIDELKEEGFNLDDGVLFKIHDTFSDVELFRDLAVDVEFLKGFFKGKTIDIKSKYNESVKDDNINSIDYYKDDFDINHEVFSSVYGKSERGSLITDLLSNKYRVYVKNFNGYVYLIRHYAETGEINKDCVLLYLLDSNNFEAINKFIENDFTDDELEYYFNVIKSKYQSIVLKNMIDRLSGNVNNYLGVDIWLLESFKSILSSKQSEDLKVINILRNQGVVDFIDDWLKNYITSSEEEATKCSNEDLINITHEFYKSIDRTGILEQEFNKLLSNGKLIFYTPEEKKQVEKEYETALSSSCYNVKADKLFVETDGTYNTFTVLVHEIMHYISYMKSNNINPQIAEFPSIYYEHLSEFFAKKKGINTNFSEKRLSNSLEHYNSLKSLAGYDINIDDYRNEDGNIDYKAIENDLVEKNGSQEYIDKFTIDCYNILDNMDSSIIFSYVFSTALAEYCMNNNVPPSSILDVCINLSDFEDVYGLLQRLNINVDKENTLYNKV